jgi:hypothetical protein
VFEALTLLLALAAIGVAWIVFRVERAAHRRDQLRGARNVLLAVQRGIVEGLPEQQIPGWGEVYFKQVYDPRTGFLRAQQSRKAVEGRDWDQVFVVPTEPLELLATTTIGGELISEETIFAANFALWRVHVFNQFVWMQTLFNVQHGAEIVDPATSRERLTTLGVVASQFSEGIHLNGVGNANDPNGWYGRLKTAVAADVEHLDDLLGAPWWRYREERRLLFGDAAVFVLAALLGALAIYQGASRSDKHGSNKPRSTPTTVVRGADGRTEIESKK